MTKQKKISTIIDTQSLSKTYADLDVPVLRDINFHVRAGEQIAIVGTSGSGKSTLLHLLGGLDQPSQGKVTLMGRNVAEMSEAERGRLRNQSLGFVYQFHHLLPEFTALENVAMPLLIRRVESAQAYAEASELLKQVGLQHRMQHMPGEMSGGERQRAALARAMVTKPQCILADEPTGNLDRATSNAVFDLLLQLNQQHGVALVVVTHDLSLAAKLRKQYALIDGQLHEQ
ncbi:MAG: lipoprotein-releasing ABC transporter ATP-binding protein LolD [Methylophilaceae bacterium]|jgi:lipoprotein-releasing system ATP-binding protein|nr:lipoprotein-releasing ABC transporter ATP-binding protein LolD [Methylophilaceae bacterium]